MKFVKADLIENLKVRRAREVDEQIETVEKHNDEYNRRLSAWRNSIEKQLDDLMQMLKELKSDKLEGFSQDEFSKRWNLVFNEKSGGLINPGFHPMDWETHRAIRIKDVPDPTELTKKHPLTAVIEILEKSLDDHVTTSGLQDMGMDPRFVLGGRRY